MPIFIRRSFSDDRTMQDDTTAAQPQIPDESYDVQESSSAAPIETEECPQLPPELLSALGEATDEKPLYGENIHHSLAQRWIPILKKGLAKDIKDKVLKEYLIPENCKLLKAPTLNPEVKAAVPEIVINRDKNIQSKQDQLGLGISALNKAITLLLLGEDKIQAIKILSDSCRILTDLHYVETQVRTRLITPCLDKSFTPLIKDHERDEMLFGEKLSETIKASKAIERQGTQIKKSTLRTTSLPTSTAGPSSSRTRFSGNGTVPPRFTSGSRGGRGGHPRAATAYRRPATTTRPRASPTRNKGRVQARR